MRLKEVYVFMELHCGGPFAGTNDLRNCKFEKMQKRDGKKVREKIAPLLTRFQDTLFFQA